MRKIFTFNNKRFGSTREIMRELTWYFTEIVFQILSGKFRNKSNNIPENLFQYLTDEQEGGYILVCTLNILSREVFILFIIFSSLILKS